MSQATSGRDVVTVVLVVLGALLLLSLLFGGFGLFGTGPMFGGGMMDHVWDGNGWVAGDVPGIVLVLGAIFQLVFLIALFVCLYLLVRRRSDSRGETDRALEELRLAYARGDLTDEEFASRRETLQEAR